MLLPSIGTKDQGSPKPPVFMNPLVKQRKPKILGLNFTSSVTQTQTREVKFIWISTGGPTKMLETL